MLTILGIDDALTIRKLFLTYLGNDYNVAVAKDEIEGIKLAKELKPDLILLDFILGDNVRGDSVCKMLLEDPATANIPVVLISSNAEDIQRTKAHYKNVIQTLLKPFKAALLTATVSTTFKLVGGKDKAPEAANGDKFEFGGRFAFMPPNEVLEVINEHRLTGALKIDNEYDFYFRDGNPVYLTTRNIDKYLTGFPYPLEDEIEESALAEAKKTQSETGLPLFVTLEKLKYLTSEGAALCTEEQTQRLFAQSWMNPSWEFQFTHGKVPTQDASRKSIHQWHLEALRHLGQDSLGLMAWGDHSGIPCFTRKGCERFFNLELTDDEYGVAQAIITGRIFSSILTSSLQAARIIC